MHPGKSLKAEEIITMNWLAQNVVGYIPEIEEMNERAQELMQLRESRRPDRQRRRMINEYNDICRSGIKAFI